MNVMNTCTLLPQIRSGTIAPHFISITRSFTRIHLRYVYIMMAMIRAGALSLG
jgi:hypothetical protein